MTGTRVPGLGSLDFENRRESLLVSRREIQGSQAGYRSALRSAP